MIQTLQETQPQISADDAPLQSTSLTVGDYAQRVIGKQYRRLIKHEEGVLADQDSEHLHQMRVAARRLGTAIQVFDRIIELPKAAQLKQVRSLGKALGQLRDLDVQITAIRENYSPRVEAEEQNLLNESLNSLKKQRQKMLTRVKPTLTHRRYEKLKTSYQRWLEEPQFTSLASLPLSLVAPDLLSPLLSNLLLHPAWLVPAQDTSEASAQCLHSLRKTCKAARYQAEFFTDFYPQPFATWVDELKQLQENLGKVQDAAVLFQILKDEIPSHAEWPNLQEAIWSDRQSALQDWDTLRQKYLSPNFRQSLHRMILESVN
ncbi:MAG: CHAD domain-containing protein [Oculatellaceae cyanobacterium Prado106]|jgi:CHAD domain-containing protein|nr:CHAD domain-containing protein [Oculatellaceae cyanobacterium Prado106]